MDRPTCRTCPYWDLVDPRVEYWEGDNRLSVREIANDPDRTVDGECRRYPRAALSDDDKHYGANKWPRTSDYDWCGEHPSFQSYIASLKQTCTDHQSEPSHLRTMSINELRLHVRPRKACNRLGLKTVDDILNTPFPVFLKVKGCGITSVHEIRHAVESLGFHWPMDGFSDHNGDSLA